MAYEIRELDIGGVLDKVAVALRGLEAQRSG